MTKPVLAVQTEEGRKYVHPITGEMVPSVTTITGMIPKDLADWAAKLAAQYVLDNWDHVSLLKERGEHNQILDLISTAHQKVRDEASGKGDVVHNSAEEWAKGGDDGNSPKHMRQLERFFQVSGFEPLHTEATLWNHNQGYAGTCDLIAKDRNGRAVLIDYKTGNSVWPEAALQLEALAMCDRIVDPQGTEVPLPLIHTVGVLHLRPQSWWWHPIQDRSARGRNWETFLLCRDIYNAYAPIRQWKSYHPNMVWGDLGRFNEANWPNRKVA